MSVCLFGRHLESQILEHSQLTWGSGPSRIKLFGKITRMYIINFMINVKLAPVFWDAGLNELVNLFGRTGFRR